MPMYEYQCQDCEEKIELIQNYEAIEPDCPYCRGPMRKLISIPADFKAGPTRAPLVRGESGAWGRRVSDTEDIDLMAGVHHDSRGKPLMRPSF